MDRQKSVLMALSGGIDSTAAAQLLIEQGYRLTGLTLVLHDDFQPAVERAQLVCKQLGIVHQLVDLSEQFKQLVIARYVDDYARGLTPNPCMVCNQAIKFGLLYDLMLKGNYDYLATGHYVLKKTIGDLQYIAKAPTKRRDQSYFLYHLSNQMINRLLFPVGQFADKAITKRIATPFFLNLAAPPESVGACFIDAKSYDSWLDEQIAVADGPIVDLSGQIIGRHDGFYKYTIGQKKGLPSVAAKDDCVLAIYAHEKRIVIGPEKYCYSSQLLLDDCNLMPIFSENNSYDIKIFNWGHLLKGKVKKHTGKRLVVDFEQPVRAVALGQYAVFYQADLVVGGGRIIAKDGVFKNNCC